MTETQTAAKPTRRTGALGVHSLDHFSLIVPDLAEARRFYSAFGLEVKDENGGLGLYAVGGGHRWGVIVEGPHKKLRYLSFGAFEDDFPRFRERLQALGVPLIEPVVPGGNSLWFSNPDGVPFEIRVADKFSPNQKSSFEPVGSTPPGVIGVRGRKDAPRARVRRLSHVGIFTPDVIGSIKFAEDTLGVRLSDRSQDIVAFTHGIHGSDHHMLAFVTSDHPGFHHVAWDVPSLQDVGLGATHMAEEGFARGWGFGRHVLGSNYFHYVRDPWGSYSEYSSDIDYIPSDMDWQAGNHAPEDALFLWGPNPPEDFITNYEDAA
jgi:catechol 2,3-dioxygenase